MIRFTFTGVKWGTDPIESADENQAGMQINLLDEQSGIMAHVPFTGESLVILVKQLIEGMTEDQKKEVLPSLSAGIHLPGRDFKPEDIIGGDK